MDPNLVGPGLLPNLDVLGVAAQLRRRRNLIIGGSIAALLIIAAGGYALWRRKRSKGKAQSEARRANRTRRTERKVRNRKGKRTRKSNRRAAAPKEAFKTAPRTQVQTLLLSKDRFRSPQDAKQWATEHKFRASKVDEKENTYRLRQHAPGLYGPDTFRTIELTDGVQAVIGKRKKYAKEKEIES